MGGHYTITGRHTGQEYLVIVSERGLTVYRPGNFRLPWVGVSGAHYGVSYHPGAGERYGTPFWLAAWRARRYVARLESAARREGRCRRRALAHLATHTITERTEP